MPPLILRSLVGTSTGNSQEIWEPRESGCLCGAHDFTPSRIQSHVILIHHPCQLWGDPLQPTSHVILLWGSKLNEPCPWCCTGSFLVMYLETFWRLRGAMSGLSISEAPTSYDNGNGNASATFRFHVPAPPLEMDWHATGMRGKAFRLTKINSSRLKKCSNKTFMQPMSFRSTCYSATDHVLR
jgi:hypothetical protein